MRILYVDIDSLRPDHLGCYGYHRNTSPVIDAIAAEGIRFDQCYVSDAPCLPSRTALWSGRHGFRTGVVGHGGTAAQPFVEGPRRAFNDTFSRTGWMSVLREAGYRTATVSSFGQRHSAWHWYAGFRDVLDPGGFGTELAPQVAEPALGWIRRHAREEKWFLHVNFWDPHTPYRTPLDFGNPFEHDAPPAWLTEDVRRRCWESHGPHSAQEPHGFGPADVPFPRMPAQIDSSNAVKQWVDGYDAGIRYADAHIDRLLEALQAAHVLDETMIVVGADHGECLGELNVWGDHQTADSITCRVPLIVRRPGAEPGVERDLHYQFDWAATLLGLAGCDVPDNWDGRAFGAGGPTQHGAGRESLVLGMGAWTCMRSVRWDRYICMWTYHGGYKDLAPVLLFDLQEDPHEQYDLAADRPDLVARAADILARWQAEMMDTTQTDVDPLLTVMREGGPWQVRGHLGGYVDHLRRTDRASAAEQLLREHAADLEWERSGSRGV
jgi:arylsulfatase A-like enzyme